MERPAKREYAQLVRIQNRILGQLEQVRDELGAPGTKEIIKEIKGRTGTSHESAMSGVMSAIEESIRALKLAEAELQESMADETNLQTEVAGAANLPAHLSRFLAERAALPGFSFKVIQDDVRGWIIAWKEYTPWGTVRGYGQFYERPYAFLDE
jgi:hypothetical protein